MRCTNDRNDLAHAGRSTVPDMTIASSPGAAVRRASEKASSSASTEANANEASAKTKTSFETRF